MTITTALVRPYLARAPLRWQPKKASLGPHRGLLMYLKGCGFHLFLVVLSPFLQLVRSIVVALDDDFL
jgi:hypothetical protein